jgi:hypothetical protein
MRQLSPTSMTPVPSPQNESLDKLIAVMILLIVLRLVGGC